MKKRVFTIGLISVVLGTASLSAQVVVDDLGTEPVQTGESVYAISAQDEFFNELLALKVEINELRVLVLDLKSEVTIKRTELNALQNSINESSKMLVDLKERNVAMQKELNQTALALENTLKERAVIEQELTQAKAELAPLNEQRDAALADISKAEADLAVLNEQKEKSQNEVSQATTVAEVRKDDRPATAAEQPTRVSFITPPANVVKRSESGVLLNTIYFNPDSTKLLTAVVPELDAIGYKMADNPGMKIAVRGYSAPAGSFLGQMKVSQARAKEAAEYLMTNFNISLDRIIIEWVGATEIPRSVMGYTNFTQYRAVELSAVL